MKVITPTELRANQKMYFDLAEHERVVIKRGKKLIELVVSDSISPSPSNDEWFDNPENIKELKERIKEHKENGNDDAVTLNGKDSIKNFFENL